MASKLSIPVKRGLPQCRTPCTRSTYLLKNMAVVRPNQVWASDISYIRLKNGFAYLCAVIDLYTRSILSWRLSPVMDERLTLSVMEDALSSYDRPDIFNSDQGSQYAAQGFVNMLVDHSIFQGQSLRQHHNGEVLENRKARKRLSFRLYKHKRSNGRD